MRIPSILVCSALSISSLHAEDLKPQEREALLAEVKNLVRDSDNTVDARFRLAVAAYREAATSDEKAYDLYMKCVEKVDFTDKSLKGTDFREWKDKQKGGDDREKKDENLGSTQFRHALVYQLRWLCLTLEGASANPDRAALRIKVANLVADFYNDLKSMDSQELILTQPVTATVFASAYGIEGGLIKDWPMTLLDLGNIYDKIILPPYRVPAQKESLKAAWLKRIDQELAIREHLTGYAKKQERERARQDNNYQSKTGSGERKQRIGMAEDMRPPEYDQFKKDEVPKLLWSMNVDVFKNCDQAEGASAMIAHLRKYVGHPSYKEWSTEMTTLLSPSTDAPKPVVEGPAPKPAGS